MSKDIFDIDQSLTKPNRRKSQIFKKHSLVVGAPLPLVIHQISRKIRDKRRKIALKEILKSG